MLDPKRAVKEAEQEMEKLEREIRKNADEMHTTDDARKRARFAHEDAVKRLEEEIVAEKKRYDREDHDLEKQHGRLEGEMHTMKKKHYELERQLDKLRRDASESERLG